MSADGTYYRSALRVSNFTSADTATCVFRIRAGDFTFEDLACLEYIETLLRCGLPDPGAVV